MKKKLRFFRHIIIVLFVGLVLVSNGFAKPMHGGDLKVLFWQFPPHFNSAIKSGASIASAGANIFVSLVEMNDKWEAVPYLAESWTTSDDGLAYTFKLAEGTVFHDGKPVTSEDVAFSINVMKENHPFGPYMFGAVDEVKTPDKYTVVITLKQPYPGLMISLSSPFTPILPKHVYSKGPILENPANINAIGSGPFKVAEYKAGEYFILERFDKFMRPGRPYLDRYIGSIINNPKGAFMAMSGGEADVFGFLAVPQMVEGFKQNKNLVVIDSGYEGIAPINFLEFNLRKEYVKDKRVRQAIAYAIDRDFITEKLHSGYSKKATGPLHSSFPFYTDQVEQYKLDLNKANALLDEAGFERKSDGMRFPLTLTYMPGDPLNQKMLAEYLKPQLKKIGIEINLKAPADFMSWFTDIAKWDHDMTMSNYFGWGDPTIGVHRMFMSTNIKHLVWTNTAGYDNEKLDKILNAAATEMDFDTRKAQYDEFQRIITDDLPLFFTHETLYHSVYSKDLLGTKPSVWGGVGPVDSTYWKNGKSPN